MEEKIEIRDFPKNFLAVIKCLLRDEYPVKLSRMLTPAIYIEDKDKISKMKEEDKAKELCFKRSCKRFNIMYIAIAAFVTGCIMVANWHIGFGRCVAFCALSLITFAFGGVLIQVIRPIARRDPGRHASEMIPGNESALNNPQYLKPLDELMGKMAEESIDSNQAKAIVNVIFSHNLHIQSLSKEHMAEWLVDRYENKFRSGRKGRYTGKVIMNAENSETYIGRWNIRINEITNTPAKNTES